MLKQLTGSTRTGTAHVQFLTVVLCVLSSLYAPVLLADIHIQITDQSGNPISNAVVSISSDSISKSVHEQVTHILDQVDKQFVPDILVMQKGDMLRFPNSDNIRHHVYSFSVPKSFEIPLYSGEPANPIKFEETGLVIAGCNIHDQMKAHIYILDNTEARLSVDGTVSFTELPDEPMQLTIYHPLAINEVALTMNTTLQHLQQHNTVLSINLKKDNIAPDMSSMSPLERKFFELRMQGNH